MKSKYVWRLIQIQLGMTLLLAMIAAFWLGLMSAQSVVLGGLACVLPNACGARMLFQYQGARAARQIVNGFYKGEALKIGLSIVLFSLIFVFFKIIPLVFFGAYIGVQMLIWCAPVIFKGKM